MSARISTWRTALQLLRGKSTDIFALRFPGKSAGLPSKLHGKRPGRFHPAQPKLQLGNAEAGAEILAGRFHFAGQLLDVGLEEGQLCGVNKGGVGSPWTTLAPSRRFADWLHSFEWLEDLLAAPGDTTIASAQALVDGWIATYGDGNDFAWEAGRLARRLFHWLALWSPALIQDASQVEPNAGSDLRRASVLAQLASLRQSARGLSPGLSRLYAGGALVMGSARITDTTRPQLRDRGLALLDTEIPLQILPDGGHVSRSPEAAAEALRLLLTLDSLLDDRGVEGSREISRAIDRIAPLVASFRRPTGELACFQSGGEMEPSDIAELLSVAPGTPKPFGYGPHTGFQRLEAGGQVVLLDTGSAPPRPFDTNTHLAPLAMDLSTVEGPLIVNCGFNPEQPLNWARPLRASAAHSTLVLDNRSPGRLLARDWMRRTIGDAVEQDVGSVRASRKEQDSGIWIEAYHEGYLADYGLCHRRRLFMPAAGDDIRGEDSLYAPVGSVPVRRDAVPFDIRFHVHPGVQVSLSQDQSSALLVVAGRAGWRFRTDGGKIALEDSVYLGHGSAPIKTQQIIVSGAAFCDSDGESRSNRVRWSFRRLRARRDTTTKSQAGKEGATS